MKEQKSKSLPDHHGPDSAGASVQLAPAVKLIKSDTDTQNSDTQLYSETQNSRNPRTSDTHDTHETHRGLGLIEVKTVVDAVAISLAGDGDPHEKLWIFCGAMKSVQITSGKNFSSEQQREGFFSWWNKAIEKGVIDPQEDLFEEWMLDFLSRFSVRKTPLGSSTLDEAMRRAGNITQNPKCSGQFSGDGIRKLLRLIMHLQDMSGDSSFGLSVRDAARFVGENKEKVWGYLRALQVMGYLILTKKGTHKVDGKTGKRLASEYLFRDR